MTWDRWLYFPSEGRHAGDFFALKIPTASAGFEPANLGTRGQHASSRPSKPLFHNGGAYRFATVSFAVKFYKKLEHVCRHNSRLSCKTPPVKSPLILACISPPFHFQYFTSKATLHVITVRTDSTKNSLFFQQSCHQIKQNKKCPKTTFAKPHPLSWSDFLWWFVLNHLIICSLEVLTKMNFHTVWFAFG
jgi:hypothetical protein